MGSIMSSGRDNDELVNLLLSLHHMSSKNVEIAFRAVDRGDYISETLSDSAYRNISCKVGNIHLSAPCVYSIVMEGLSLRPGLSFLNIGSGTGYLSTIAGLILGDDGTNHGIEMHEDCVIYAQEHLEQFKRKSLDVDVFEFCEPVFQLGNILNVMPTRQYDRVYCGAACPEVYEKFIKQFVKIGGILVMPYKDQLLRSKRTGKETWRNNTMLPVSFTTLMSPQVGADRSLLQLPSCTPRSLQEICRSLIRRRLRKMVWAENKNLVAKERLTPSSEDDEVTFLGWQSEIVLPLGRDGLMNASAPRILEECIRLFVTPDMMNDSDDTETETEGLFAPSCRANPFPMRDRLMSASTDPGSNDEENEDEENAGAEAGAKGNATRERFTSASTYFGSTNDEDDEDAEDAGAGAKKKEQDENTMDFEMDNCDNRMQKVPIEDETESADKNKNSGEREIRQENQTKQSASKNAELSSGKKKRNASGKSNDSCDDAESFPRGFLKNGATKSSSVHKRALLKMESLKEFHSDSSESLSDGETPDKISRSIATNSKNVANDRDLHNESISSEYDFETEESPPRPSFSPFSMLKHLKNQTTKIQSLSVGEKRDGDDEYCCGSESAKIGDKKERIEDSSNLSSSEDEHEKANSVARSDYHRACLKRRSERKSTFSGTDATSIFGKKSNISNNSSENSPSSASNGTCNFEEISSTSGSERSSRTAAIDSIISETSEFSTSDGSSSDNYCSDSDQDFFLNVRDSHGKHAYAHRINKQLVASCMKNKIMQLPLPPPLLFYINYNRELV